MGETRANLVLLLIRVPGLRLIEGSRAYLSISKHKQAFRSSPNCVNLVLQTGNLLYTNEVY
jgi:hypothetical protein